MCWANNVAHRTRKHGDVETNNTTAHPQQGTYETRITSAPEKHAKNLHFSPAKAMAVSDDQAAWPTGPGHGARGRRRSLTELQVAGQRYKRRQTNTI